MLCQEHSLGGSVQSWLVSLFMSLLLSGVVNAIAQKPSLSRYQLARMCNHELPSP